MKKIVINLVFIFVTFLTYSQVDSSRYDWGVFVSPLSIFNPSYPAFHVGSEREFGKWSALAELGVLLPKSVYQDESSVIGLQDFSGRNRGFFLKFEGKRYFNRFLYVAGNFQFLYNNTRRTDVFDGTPELTQSYAAYGIHYFCTTCIEETYSIKKSMIGLAVKIGVKFDLPKNFYLDGYLGLGVNYHSNKHSANDDLHKHPAQTADGLISYYDTFHPGSYFYHLPVPTIGLRVGYTLP